MSNAYRTPTNPTTVRKYRDVQARFKDLSNKVMKVEGYEVKLRYNDIIAILMQEFYYSQENAVIRVLNTPLPEENEKAPA